MADGPLVSVVVATYNQKKVVVKALDSILSQTYKNLEIIISDDGSTDGTRDLLICLARKNSNVSIYLQEVNLGITDNYNFLTDKAVGKYVSVFSGDDIMCPEKIESQVKLLELYPEASFCHHSVFDLDAATEKVRGVISHQYVNGNTLIHDLLRNFGVPGSMSVMYRRSMARKPVFDPEIRTASDWLNLIHLAMVGNGLYIDVPLCYYRRDDNYNSKDVSKYESDFEKTIELTRCSYAIKGDSIDRSCDYALARYSLGAGYRSLMRGDHRRARKFFAVKMPDSKFIVYSFILNIISYLPINGKFLVACKRLYKAAQKK